MTIASAIRSRGNRRLWLVLSILWAVFAGFYFWESLPQQPGDTSFSANELCNALKSAEATVIGERAFNACIAKGAAEAAPEALPGLRKTMCETERSSTITERRSELDARKFDCIATQSAELQPEADRAIDRARLQQILRWLTLTFLPPIALPLLLALFAVALSATTKWVATGYKGDN
jgi:hypothetical protein